VEKMSVADDLTPKKQINLLRSDLTVT
jgi:hypothetical protein